MTVHEKMTALADCIREKTSVRGPLTLDDMKKAIDSIKENSFSGNFNSGTFTVTEDMIDGNFPIEHGLSGIPNIVLVYKEDAEKHVYKYRGFVTLNLWEEYDTDLGYIPQMSVTRVFSDTESGVTSYSNSADFPDTRKEFFAPDVSSTRKYDLGLSYRWIAIRFES